MWWHWGPMGHMGAGGMLGAIFMGLLWIALIVAIVLIVRSIVSRPSRAPWTGAGNEPPSTASSALQILEERYAKGEIGRDEFIQRKADLTGGGTTPPAQP